MLEKLLMMCVGVVEVKEDVSDALRKNERASTDEHIFHAAEDHLPIAWITSSERPRLARKVAPKSPDAGGSSSSCISWLSAGTSIIARM